MEWILTPSTGRQPEPRSFHTCTAIGNRVIVIGGRSPENIHFDGLHIFDTGKPATNLQHCSFCSGKQIKLFFYFVRIFNLLTGL